MGLLVGVTGAAQVAKGWRGVACRPKGAAAGAAKRQGREIGPLKEAAAALQGMRAGSR